MKRRAVPAASLGLALAAGVVLWGPWERPAPRAVATSPSPVASEAAEAPAPTPASEDPAETPARTSVPRTSPRSSTAPASETAPRIPCTATAPPTTGSMPGDDPHDGKAWVTVGYLQGSCEASSPAFSLSGIDTRLSYRSDADTFNVFLVDAEQGLDATAGYAEAECSGPCGGSQVVVSPPGRYYLLVRAGDAPWEVAVQEYRSP